MMHMAASAARPVPQNSQRQPSQPATRPPTGGPQAMPA